MLAIKKVAYLPPFISSNACPTVIPFILTLEYNIPYLTFSSFAIIPSGIEIPQYS